LLIDELTKIILIDYAETLAHLQQQSDTPPSKNTS